MSLRIEIFEDANHEYRWRAIEANGRIIAGSGEGYVSIYGAEAAVSNIVQEMRGEVRQVRRATLTHMPRGVEQDSHDYVTDFTFPAVNIVNADASG